MILGVAAWVLNASVLLATAIILTRALRAEGRSLRLLAGIIVSLFVITLFMLLAGLFGWLRPLPIALLSLGICAALLAIPASRTALRELPGGASSGWEAARLWWTSLPAWLRWSTGIAALLHTARFAFLIAALPPFVWDSLTYHLTNVAHWTQQGRIELFATPVTRIYNPANFEVLAAWFTLFLHHDVVVEAAGLPAYLLAGVAVYVLGREMGLSAAGAWISSLTYGATPALLLAATGTKNDPHMAAYYLAIVALLWGLFRTRPAGQPTHAYARLLLLAMALGLAAGTKAYIAHLLPGAILVAGCLLFQGRAESGALSFWRRWTAEMRPLGRGRQTLAAGLLVGACFLGGYWNLRNWAITGNPFYPYGVQIESAQVLTGDNRDSGISLARLQGNLESLANKFGDRLGPILPDLPETTGWGLAAYGLGLPALAWALVRRPSARILAAGFGLSLLLLFLSDRPSPWNMRYAIWFPALLALCIGLLFDALPNRQRFERVVLISLLLGAWAFSYLQVVNYGRVSLGEFRQMLSLRWVERDAARLDLNVPAAYRDALGFVPPGDVLGYRVGPNGFVYPLYRANFAQRLTYIPMQPGETCDLLAASMRQHGTRWLFVAMTDDSATAHAAACAGQGQLLLRSEGLYELAGS